MASKVEIAINRAQTAAESQEDILRDYRNRYKSQREYEQAVTEEKQAIVKIQQVLDFTSNEVVSEDGHKISGTLRLPDNSFQVTKTVSKDVVTDLKSALKDNAALADLLKPFEVVSVSYDMEKALDNPTIAAFLARYQTESVTVRFTPTLDPK